MGPITVERLGLAAMGFRPWQPPWRQPGFSQPSQAQPSRFITIDTKGRRHAVLMPPRILSSAVRLWRASHAAAPVPVAGLLLRRWWHFWPAIAAELPRADGL